MANKYKKLISGKCEMLNEQGELQVVKLDTQVDVYDVINAWGVTDPALQHALKKILQPGQRGHKDEKQDLEDIIASVKRRLEDIELVPINSNSSTLPGIITLAPQKPPEPAPTSPVFMPPVEKIPDWQRGRGYLWESAYKYAQEELKLTQYEARGYADGKLHPRPSIVKTKQSMVSEDCLKQYTHGVSLGIEAKNKR